MPASTDQRAFGQVWTWERRTRYLLIAPDTERSMGGLDAWWCLYLGTEAGTPADVVWRQRIADNTYLLDSLAWYGDMEQWERLA